MQDKYSIRCAPAHRSASCATCSTGSSGGSTIEINSSDDNPLFNVAGGRVESGGNFYGGHIGQAMDSLKVALANLCDLIDRQLELLVDEKFNRGLTPNLIPRFEPDRSRGGLAPRFQGNAAVRVGDDRRGDEALRPATIHSRSTECHNQDKVSMGTIAARDARSIVELAQNMAAIHLIACCQALELRGVEKASPRTSGGVPPGARAHPVLGRDRYLDVDIATTVALIQSGAVSEFSTETTHPTHLGPRRCCSGRGRQSPVAAPGPSRRYMR